MRDTECIRTLPGPTVDGMTTTILATIGAVVLLLETATRVPPALTDLVRALIPVREALHELLRQPDSSQKLHPGLTSAKPRRRSPRPKGPLTRVPGAQVERSS